MSLDHYFLITFGIISLCVDKYVKIVLITFLLRLYSKDMLPCKKARGQQNEHLIINAEPRMSFTSSKVLNLNATPLNLESACIARNDNDKLLRPTLINHATSKTLIFDAFFTENT